LIVNGFSKYLHPQLVGKVVFFVENKWKIGGKFVKRQMSIAQRGFKESWVNRLKLNEK
jgi:hypothetical protein